MRSLLRPSPARLRLMRPGWRRQNHPEASRRASPIISAWRSAGGAGKPGTHAGARSHGRASRLANRRAGAASKRRSFGRSREERRTGRLPAQRRSRARLSVLFRRRLFLLSPVRHCALSRRSARRPVRDAARDPPADQELTGAHAVRSRSIFGARVVELIDAILKVRLKRTTAALDALRRQYPQYAAALEARFLRQSAMRREMGRYDALFQEGLIAAEVYEDLKGSVADRKKETRPRFDLGLDTRELIGRLDLFADLNEQQLERVQKLLRPRFVAPRETIVRRAIRATPATSLRRAPPRSFFRVAASRLEAATCSARWRCSPA